MAKKDKELIKALRSGGVRERKLRVSLGPGLRGRGVE
jgi:hypothetical protein